jgi:PAS domain S-box-containing protein
MNKRTAKHRTRDLVSPLRIIVGPVLTAIALAIFAISTTRVDIALGSSLLLGLAAFSSFTGGVFSGLASAALTLAYYLVVLSAPGELFGYDARALGQLISFAVVLSGLTLLGAVARGAAATISLERLARAEAERSRRAAERRLAVVHATSVALTEARTVAEAAPRILESVCESLGWETGLLWEVHEAASVLRCVEVWHAPGARVEEFLNQSRQRTFDAGIGLPGRVWATGAPAWIPDVVIDDNFPRASYALAVGLHGAIGFPILSGRKVDGVIEFFSRTIEEPDQDLIRMLGTIGAQIGEHIERMRTEEAVRRSEVLKGAILESALDSIFTIAEKGTIVEVNPAAEQSFGYSREELIGKKVDETILPSFGADLLLELGHYLSSGESSVFGKRLELPALRSDGTELVVELSVSPVVLEGNPLFTATLHDITERKREEQTQAFFAEVGAVLGSSLSYEGILKRVAELAVPFLGDCCFVDSVEANGSLRRVTAAYADPARCDFFVPFDLYLESPYEGHPVIKVLRSGKPVISEVTDAFLEGMSQDPDHLRNLSGIKLEYLLVVPLQARGRIVGVLSLISAGSGRRYDQRDVTVAETLASRVGTALDNALLFRERSQIARTLQQSLLPLKIPSIPGIEVGTLYRAGREGHEVGGDFYEIFQYGTHWGVVIGDVSGRGVPAAALTGLVRYTVRSEAMQEKEPSRILSTLNQAIIAQTKGDQFCTVIFTRLDLADQGAHLAVVSAGHPLPLVLRNDGSLETIRSSNPLLGIIEEVELAEQLLVLGPGDAIVFYTDGVLDARADGQIFGEENLASVVKASEGSTAEQIAKNIESAVLDFTKKTLRDDIAIVTLRITP